MPRPLICNSRPWECCWNLEHDLTGRCRGLHAGSKRCLPRGYGKLVIKIAAYRAVERIGLELDLEIEIAGWQLADPRRALAFEANILALGDAFRDRDIEFAIFQRDVARRVDLGHPQRNRPRRTAEGVTKVDQDLGMVVLAACMKLVRRARGSRTAASPGEQVLEKIAEIVSGAVRRGRQKTRNRHPNRAAA